MPGRSWPGIFISSTDPAFIMQIKKNISAWKYAAIPVLFVLFVAFYPQASLLVSRGAAWNGTFFITNYDETAYAAYVNALIDGKARKTDPFSGRGEAEYESLYSIQFVPAYLMAVPSRALGLETSAAFLVLNFFVALASALAMFWLIRTVTGNDALSAVGTIFVFALGTAAAFQGELRQLLQGSVVVDYFPFLRRYLPAVPFPLFILYLGLLWKSFTAESSKRSVLFAVLAGACFSVLVFSYFFLWTAALAFFAVFAGLSFLFANDKKNVLTSMGVFLCFTVSLWPYFTLLDQRSPEIDSVQLLIKTHAPDIWSLPVIIGLVSVALSLLFNKRNYFSLSQPLIVFAIACGLTPLVLLNQQIVTGRSLQPIHYEIFAANYLSLLSLVAVASAIIKSEKFQMSGVSLKKALVYVGLLCAAWGFVEAATATNRSIFAATVRDRSAAAIKLVNKPDNNEGNSVVLTPDMVTADFLSSISDLRPLWSPHLSSGGGISLAENKRRFYLYLYLNGITPKELADALHNQVFEVTAAIFGTEQALPELQGGGAKIRDQDIASETSKYAGFVSSISPKDIYYPMVGHIIVPQEAEPDYSNLDNWYRRELAGESDGFKIYKLTPLRSIP